jgi:O-antigen ligase
VVVILTGVYFVNIPTYVAVMQTPIPRLFTTASFLLLLAPVVYVVLRDPERRQTLGGCALLYWCYGFALLTLVGFFFSVQSMPELQWFQRRLVSILYLLGFLLLFSAPWSHRLARQSVAVAVIVGVLLNVYDFANPGQLIPIDMEFANPGRAAGLYLNANRSGLALLLGLIISLNVIPRRWQTPCLVAASTGIMLTFSRAAVLGLVVALGCFAFLRWLSWRQICIAGSTGLAGVALIGFVVLQQFDSEWVLRVNAENIAQRIDYFAGPFSSRDASANERMLVAWTGLKYFSDSPLIGHGVGFTHVWRFGTSTHNMYLALAVEYGFLGLLVFPLLIVAMISRAGVSARPWVITAGGVIAVVAFFTHNALDEFPFLILYAITSLSRLADRPGETLGPMRPQVTG